MQRRVVDDEWKVIEHESAGNGIEGRQKDERQQESTHHSVRTSDGRRAASILLQQEAIIRDTVTARKRIGCYTRRKSEIGRFP